MGEKGGENCFWVSLTFEKVSFFMLPQQTPYLRGDDVGLDLLLRDGHVLQDHLQPHGHHTGHPVDQTGADVT